MSVSMYNSSKDHGLAIVGGQKPRTASVEYHGRSGQWVTMPSLPVPTSSAQIVWNPDTHELFTFGGYQSVRGKGASSNDVYKIKVKIFNLKIPYCDKLNHTVWTTITYCQ